MASIANSAPELQEKRQFRVHTERVDTLVKRLDTAGDPEVRAMALELVQCVVELHGAALERMIETIAGTPAGETVLDHAIEDDLVASVLLLHGLHPDSMEVRVEKALAKVRPYLNSHKGDVEFVSLHDGIVRLRLVGTCGSCPSSSVTLKNAVEEALYEAAPDIVEIIAEDRTAELNSAKLVVLK